MEAGQRRARLRYSQRGSSSRTVILIILIVAAVGIVALSGYNHVNRVNVPVDYANDVEHVKYGSIGSDTPLGIGLPYWIWATLPDVCPSLLPRGYASLGIVQEPGRDRPIGFSKRRYGMLDFVGLNCSICHTATVRETAASERQVYLAAPGHQVDLWGYFNFLFTCGRSDDFNEKNVLEKIEARVTSNGDDFSMFDRVMYKFAVRETKDGFNERWPLLEWVLERPLWGPGRVDTFNPYKTLIFGKSMEGDTSIGTADFLSIWNQALREGYAVHWDGNNSSVDERNLSAAMGAGATPETVDIERIERVKEWIWNLKAPSYPFPIDRALARQGKAVYYKAKCNDCHDPGGAYIGQVVSASSLRTDSERTDSFDENMAKLMNSIGEGYPWAFKEFRSTDGYVNTPLDGAWLRAPYLHNGSVPTMRDLLNRPAERPSAFYKGNDVYDQKKMGFVHDVPERDGHRFFRFDTALRGNGNGGHTYGVDLSDVEKDALVEYLKTL